MKKKYNPNSLLLLLLAITVFAASSCKKDKKATTNTPVVATPTKLGLYEFGETDTYNFKEVEIAISKVGTQSVDYGLVFDTGSGGLVMDASGILPASMITSSGFNFTGDSLVVDGITITNKTQMIEYGDDSTVDKVYGNLAYAPVTIGDSNGSIVVKRLPFFLYYKAVDNKNNTYPVHEFDVFGTLEYADLTFSDGSAITSPFTLFDPGNGLTKGFKLAALGTTNFSSHFTYVPGVLTLGLTTADLASASGFTSIPEIADAGYGYVPYFKSTIVYGTKSVPTYVLLDTGTDPYNFIESSTAPTDVALLPVNTSVSVTFNNFNYSYVVTATDNLTYLENTSISGNPVSILGLQYFLTNEYLMDYTNHNVGVKNN